MQPQSEQIPGQIPGIARYCGQLNTEFLCSDIVRCFVVVSLCTYIPPDGCCYIMWCVQWHTDVATEIEREFFGGVNRMDFRALAMFFGDGT